MHTYRGSCLAYAAVRMWRAWQILVPVVVLNAVLQAFVIWPPYAYGQVAWDVIAAIASGIVLWAAFGLLTCGALLAPKGPVTWPSVLALARPRLLAFGLWGISWGVLVAIGMSFYVFPAAIIAALLVYLPLTVLDGEAKPLRGALALVRQRFWRWLITVLIAAGVLFFGWLVAGFGAFFLRGPLATSVIWLVGGVIISWITTAFALVFVDARASLDAPDSKDRLSPADLG